MTTKNTSFRSTSTTKGIRFNNELLALITTERGNEGLSAFLHRITREYLKQKEKEKKRVIKANNKKPIKS